MPQSKLLLGWMSQREAVDALSLCVFDEPITRKKMKSLWGVYRDKVAALEPRDPGVLQPLNLTPAEQEAAEIHMRGIQCGDNGRFLSNVVKVDAGNLIAKQFSVLTERSSQYACGMRSEQGRINECFGIGKQFNGELVVRQVNHKITAVELPHHEFVILPKPQGIDFRERDRYITAIRDPRGRLVLWAGYHRTHAVLCHIAGDAAGVAPLLTVMTGIPEVEAFFARPSPARDTVFGERPALLRDFLDGELFISVNLRKKRAEGRIEQIRPGKFKASIILVNDNT
jgi:hypothetical protein